MDMNGLIIYELILKEKPMIINIYLMYVLHKCMM